MSSHRMRWSVANWAQQMNGCNATGTSKLANSCRDGGFRRLTTLIGEDAHW